MSHDHTLICRVCETLKQEYDPTLYDYVVEKMIAGTRMFPDITIVAKWSRKIVCVVEIGGTSPDKLIAGYGELKIPNVRWYDKQGVLHYNVTVEPTTETLAVYDQCRLVPDRLVAERYGRSTKTIERWGNDPELGFPPCIYLRNRRHRDAAALDAWDAKQRAAAGVAA
jgi:hypothetical protein